MGSYSGVAPATSADIPNSSIMIPTGKWLILLTTCIQYGTGRLDHECNLVDGSGNIIVHNGLSLGNVVDSAPNSHWCVGFNFYTNTSASEQELHLTHQSDTGSATLTPRVVAIRIG